jgi:hypothetical protein
MNEKGMEKMNENNSIPFLVNLFFPFAQQQMLVRRRRLCADD